MKGFAGQIVRVLHPSYCAMMMVTGIVSIAAYLLSMVAPAWVLFGLGLIAYAVLWILTLARLLWYLPSALFDLTDYTLGPGFLTIVAWAPGQ